LPIIDETMNLAREFVFDVWARPGLEPKTRSAVTIALVTALGRSEELAYHINAGLNFGLTPEEIMEVLFHTGVYAGIPAMHAAQPVAQAVFRERGILQKI
jgi:4-carboxymuconolactone decarboxylase